jgi:hypothetical protein
VWANGDDHLGHTKRGKLQPVKDRYRQFRLGELKIA